MANLPNSLCILLQILFLLPKVQRVVHALLQLHIEALGQYNLPVLLRLPASNKIRTESRVIFVPTIFEARNLRSGTKCAAKFSEACTYRIALPLCRTVASQNIGRAHRSGHNSSDGAF